ncbi:Cellulase (glycosyl hydrolase family 5) [Planctomycetes bacterium CA13]|uniref:Cellulase (Glycosyl hydrolase family 5) n=1 Tax=Novipirellula herctigrandis TaxID=2527986 RepID=A0A5C5ZCK1_9BACT|nr:Cellulase (glycosyl hydrolase family 5) [Planctomycetes bacterium CA13]
MIRKIMFVALAVLLTAASTGYGQVTPATDGWFVFDVPALAVPDGGLADLSYLNSGGIPDTGFVSVRDGHFVDAEGQRLRLFGTNVTGDSCFPDQGDAALLARRLRQYGFNCLRLHFMDHSWSGSSRDSLWDDPDTGKLSQPSLAKLDRLIAECAANGIYLNLNLHVGREYPGQPTVAGSRAFRYSKNLDRWHEPYIRQMEAFCRDLLGHVNPHTQRRYADEPTIACVEINNENTMIRDELSDLRRLPEPLIGDLQQQWTNWLHKTYGSTEALRKAWDADVVPLGDEQFTNTDAWQAQNAGGAESTLEKDNSRLTWTATQSGSEDWNLQLQYKDLQLDPGRYTLTFRARSRDSLRVSVNVMLDAVPYGNVGLHETIELSPNWQSFTFSGPIKAASAPGKLRLNISLRNKTGQVELDNVRLRPGGGQGLMESDSLEDGVGLPAETAVAAVRLDWMAFLIDTEMATTKRIVQLLKDEIGCKMAVADTQVSYGGVAGVLRESTLSDYVDIHGYWQHPSYTRNDAGHVTSFRIANTSQVADADGGTLARMGVYRIAGRPFSISEYNTPAPNDHGAELLPLFTAVASMQDWDAFYSYTYRDFGKDYANTFMRSYFHLIGRANVLVHAPACSLAFRKGLIATSADGAECRIPVDQVPPLTFQAGTVEDVWRSQGGDPAAVWQRKVTVDLVQSGEDATLSGDASVSPGVRLSDTNQIRWNPNDPDGSWFSLDAPAVRFLIGHVGGRTFDVGDVQFAVHDRDWPGDVPAYACISLVALDGKPLAESQRMLLAASARCENSEMPWNEDRTGFTSNNWGQSPTVSEGVPLDLTVPGGPVRAWRLTADARKAEELPLNNGIMQLRPEHETLWVFLTRQ